MKRRHIAERSRLVSGLARILRHSLGLLVVCIGGGLAQASAPVMQLPGQVDVTPGGALSYSIPIAVPAGTAGMVPALTLDYSSQGGNGIVGQGWSLSGLPAIARCPQTFATDGAHGAVRYDANDRYCLDGARLMVIAGSYGADGSEYRTEIESFSKVIAHGTAGAGPAWFEVHTKAGQIMELGNTPDSQILAQGKTSASSWAVNKISDTKGNYLTVTYVNDNANGQAYPTRIDYTGNASAGLSPRSSVQFSYNSNRPDQVPLYHAGSLIKTTVLLTNIKTYRGTTLVSDYQLTYQLGDSINPSKLTSVRLCSGTGNTCLPPTRFTWSGGTTSYSAKTLPNFGTNVGLYAGDYAGTGRSGLLVRGWGATLYAADPVGTLTPTGFSRSDWNNESGIISVCPGDWNGDGKADVIVGSISGSTYTSTGSGFSAGSPAWARSCQALDLNGDGLADYLYAGWQQNNPAVEVMIGDGNGNFTQVQTLAYGDEYALGDFDGDGLTDFIWQAAMQLGATTPLYLSTGSGLVNVGGAWAAGASAYLIGDFNGDGATDFLANSPAGQHALYLSKGDGTFVSTGWTVPTTWEWGVEGGPPTVYVADVNGDGRSDIVEVGANATTIWLSTGSGFVASANMGLPVLHGVIGAPGVTSEVFADFNGDGISDIVDVAYTNSTMYDSQAVGEYVSSYAPLAVTGVSSGLGAATTVAYKPLTDSSVYAKGASATYPTEDVQQARYVVSRVDAANGVGGNYSSSYSYSNAQADLRGRGSLGFGQMKTLDLQTGILQTTNFRQDYPFIGLVASQTRTLGSQTLGTATNSYTTTNLGGTRNLPLLTQTVEVGTDLDGTALPTITTSYQYDSYGNKTQIAVSRSDGSSKTTNNSYSNNATSWILGRLTSTAVTNDFPHSAPGSTNRAPLAANDSKSTHAGIALTFDPRTNDSDPDGDPLTVTAKTDGAHGFVQILSGGTQLKYIPNAGYVGTDSFTYTIADGVGGTASATVTMTMGNTVPVAVNDTMGAAPSTATAIDPRANDSDPDGDALTITAKTDGAHGTVAITGGGTGVTYTPASGYGGADSFTYTIADGNGGTASGTVSVTVSAANPTITTASLPGGTAGVAYSATLVATDPNNYAISWSVTVGSLPAGLSLAASTGVISGAPTTAGTTSFTVQASNGHGGLAAKALSITVAANSAPTANTDSKTVNQESGANTVTVLANDTDPDGDALTVTAVTQGAKGSVAIASGGGSVTYTPANRVWGADSFTYTMSDGHGHTASATVNVTINQVDEIVMSGLWNYPSHYELVLTDYSTLVIDDWTSAAVYAAYDPPQCNTTDGWAAGFWVSGCNIYKDLTP